MFNEPGDARINRLYPARVMRRLRADVDGALRVIDEKFKLGVLVNLGGEGGDGRFHEVTRDTIDDYLASISARETFEVADRLGGRGNIAVSLRFDSLASITPDNVAMQVPAVKRYLDVRDRLLALKDVILHNAAAQDLLSDALTDQNLLVKLAALANEIDPEASEGGDGSGSPAPAE